MNNDNVQNLLTKGITLFYSKRTGEIVSFSACSTPQNFEDYFGTQSEDMKLIYDCIFTDFEQNLITNTKDYKVLEGKVVKKENEIEFLKNENEQLKIRLEVVQSAVDDLIFMMEV